MSSTSLTQMDALFGSLSTPSVSRFIVRPIKQLAFWTAVVLPFMHLSLLVAGLESQSMVLSFVALLALNVVALYVGHPYRRE